VFLQNLRKLLASMTVQRLRRRGSAQPLADGEEVAISRRLQELLDVTKPKHGEASTSKTHPGNDGSHAYRGKN
jgi:hypothetical protein